MKRIKPLKDRLVIKRAEFDETTKAGILIPQSSQEKPIYGEILDIGPLITGLKVGDLVLFGKYSGVEVNMDGEKYVLLREEEIYGYVIEEKN